MATLRNQRAEWQWPAELGTFDSQRWSSRAAWHLARAHAAPSKLVALNEIRASVREPGAEVDDRAGVVIVQPPGGDVIGLGPAARYAPGAGQ
jgi:hypothetical protein